MNQQRESVQWQEPVSFRNAINQLYMPERLYLRIPFFIALGISLLMLLIPVIRGPIDGNWPMSILVSFCVGYSWFIGMLLIALVNRYSSRLIGVSGSGILIKEWRGAAISFTSWGWQHFTHFTIETMDLERRRYLALIGHLKSGQKLYLGVNWLNRPRSRPVDQIVNIVAASGLQIHRLA